MSLRKSGRNDVADTISNLLGTPLHGNKSDDGKFRFAYLFVNSINASMDDQSKMLHEFIAGLKKTRSRDIEYALEGMKIIPVTLPKGIIVLAMRIPLSLYNESQLPGILANHPFMKAYLRKPRKDTQHLAQQAQEQAQVKTKTTDTKL